MIYLLGIDQGSTQTRAAICNEKGVILSLGVSPGACHSIHGMARSMQSVSEASLRAMQEAGITPAQIHLLHGGFTGADWPDEYGLLHANLLRLGLACEVNVTNDSLVALRGGTTASYGAIVIAGTGANCAILSPTGQTFVYHYYIESRLQGGVALGRQALTAIYRSATGREPETSLTAAVTTALGFLSVDELLRAQSERRLTEEQVKGLAPLIFQIAEEGDGVAQGIIRSFGAGLSELVTAGLRRFSMTSMDVEVILSGSIFKGPGRLLQDVMSTEIRRIAPRAHLVNARYEPVVGSLLLGLESCGILVEGEVMSNIDRSSQRLNLIRIPE